MEIELKMALARQEQLAKEKERLDTEWADKFGTFFYFFAKK